MSSVNETKQNVNIRTANDGSRWLLTTDGSKAYGVVFDTRAGRDIFIRQAWNRVPNEVRAAPVVTEPHYTHADYFSGDYGRW